MNEQLNKEIREKEIREKEIREKEIIQNTYNKIIYASSKLTKLKWTMQNI